MLISAIIPAYNEEKTIGNVLSTLSSIDFIDEIIVVSDGSCDRTVSIAKRYNVRIIELSSNQGKSNAVLKGVSSTKADIILMLDADLIGLTREHVISLIEPIINDNVDMTIGIFKNGRGVTDFAQKIAPFLSGQRAIKREVFDKLKKHRVKDYGIEMALMLMAQEENMNVKSVYLKDMTHVMKEEKHGFLHGFLLRLKMYLDIIFIFLAIKLKLEVL